MKLWFVFMFDRVRSGTDQAVVFLVRALDPMACTQLVESCKPELPGYINPFVTGIVEMGEDPYSETPALLAGPLSSSINYDSDEFKSCWRREQPNGHWVNFNKQDQNDPLLEHVQESNPEISIININSEEDILKAAHNILDGAFDNDLHALGDQLDLCLGYLRSHGLLDQCESQKSHPLIRAIHYLTKKLIEKADVINTCSEDEQ